MSAGVYLDNERYRRLHEWHRAELDDWLRRMGLLTIGCARIDVVDDEGLELLVTTHRPGDDQCVQQHMSVPDPFPAHLLEAVS